jgi:hypothetical protein
MGASIEESIKGILLLGDNLDTKTHPNKTKRVTAIKEGWNEAAKLRYDGAIPPPPHDIPIENGEFFPDMLHDLDFIKRHALDSTSPSFYIGIITEVDPDYNAGGIEIFTERKLKTGDLEKDYNYNMVPSNTKEMFNLEWEPSGRMTQVEKSYFYELLKPGRQIIFSCVQEGSAGHLWITYLKQIPANK